MTYVLERETRLDILEGSSWSPALAYKPVAQPWLWLVHLGKHLPYKLSTSSSARWWASDVMMHQAVSGLLHPTFSTQINELPTKDVGSSPFHR